MATTVGVVLHRSKPDALAALQVAQLAAPDARFVMDQAEVADTSIGPTGVELVAAGRFESEVDLVLVLGGDGTLIHAASLLKDRLVPLLGVNLGRIGFLTDVAQKELIEVLPRALAGELAFVDRMRLEVEVRRGAELLLAGRVLNDAVVNQLGLARLAEYRVTYGGQLVTTLRANGVIIATPTGSTAYSMAAGGSILTPGLQGIAITPICPHAVTQRPLVVSPDREIRVTLESGSQVYVSLDGRAGREVTGEDVMTVKRAAVGTRLLEVPWRGYFETLRTKLGWGEA